MRGCDIKAEPGLSVEEIKEAVNYATRRIRKGEKVGVVMDELMDELTRRLTE